MNMKHTEIKPMTWVSPEFSVASKCDLDIYARENECLVIVTERPDNKGLGLEITEGPGIIAQTLYHWYGYEPENMTWIECDPDRDFCARVALQCSDHQVKDWVRTPCSYESVAALKADYLE
ncbi:MAG: hypothetical protein PHS63_06040 [Desulfoplanes sp.]|nr:hypothetical protein [Desulfoplanes sp.]